MLFFRSEKLKTALDLPFEYCGRQWKLFAICLERMVNFQIFSSCCKLWGMPSLYMERMQANSTKDQIYNVQIRQWVIKTCDLLSKFFLLCNSWWRPKLGNGLCDEITVSFLLTLFSLYSGEDIHFIRCFPGRTCDETSVRVTAVKIVGLYRLNR